MTTTSVTTTARKLLLPLGSVVGAGVLAMVMGVPWTSASEGSSGIRLLADDNQGATLTISKIEPGESVSRSVTIRNSGGEQSRLSFEETGDPSPFADGELHLVIDQDGRTALRRRLRRDERRRAGRRARSSRGDRARSRSRSRCPTTRRSPTRASRRRRRTPGSTRHWNDRNWD